MPARTVRLGEPAPEFELDSLSGRRFTHNDLLERPTHLLMLRHLG